MKGVLRCYQFLFHEISSLYKIQDFVSVLIFILQSLYQTIENLAVLCLLNAFLFFLQQSSCSLNFLFLTLFVLKATWTGINFFFKWEINSLWCILWHIWHKMLKQRQGFVGFVSKHMPALGESISGELTIDCNRFLIDSAAIHLFWLSTAIPSCSSPRPAARQRNHYNLHSHHTAPSPSVWIFAYWLEKGIKKCLKSHFINNLWNTSNSEMVFHL